LIEDTISEEVIQEEVIQKEVIEEVIEEVKEEIIPETETKTPNQEVKKNRIIKTKSSDFGNIVLKPK
jgi:hypothetical protein